jgi:hypothetical protein
MKLNKGAVRLLAELCDTPETTRKILKVSKKEAERLFKAAKKALK